MHTGAFSARARCQQAAARQQPSCGILPKFGEQRSQPRMILSQTHARRWAASGRRGCVQRHWSLVQTDSPGVRWGLNGYNSSRITVAKAPNPFYPSKRRGKRHSARGSWGARQLGLHRRTICPDIWISSSSTRPGTSGRRKEERARPQKYACSCSGGTVRRGILAPEQPVQTS